MAFYDMQLQFRVTCVLEYQVILLRSELTPPSAPWSVINRSKIFYICEKSKTFTNVCLRIILDNYFRLIFGHMTADAKKVNESRNSCILLTNIRCFALSMSI